MAGKRGGKSLLLGSEKSVLAAIVEKPNRIFDIHKLSLDESDFSNPMMRQLYTAVLRVANELDDDQGDVPLDPLILEEAVAQSFPAAYKEGPAEYSRVIRAVSDFQVNNLNHHIRIVATESYKRKVLRHLKKVNKAIPTFNDPISLIQHLEQTTLEFTGGLFHQDDVVHMGEGYIEWISELAIRAKEGKVDLGFSSGFNHYDAAIGGGMERGCVNVIAARPKRGKSFIGLQISQHVASKGIPVLYLDTELSKDIQYARMTSMQTHVPFIDVKSGDFVFDQSKSAAIKRRIKSIKAMPLHYVKIGGWTIEQQVSVIRRWFTRTVGKDEDGRWNQALVVLDYLKLMSSTDKRNDKEWEALGYRMTLLKDLMGQYDNPMLAFAQQNKEGIEREDASTISGSDRIIWLCDSFAVWALKSDDEISAGIRNIEEQADNEQAEDAFTNMKLIVAEARHGPGTSGGRYIGFYFDGKDPRISREEFCGIIEEKGFELPWSRDSRE